MIQVNDLQYPTCELYDGSKNLIGVIKNELQLNDVRVQIREQKLTGYYFDFQKQTIQIDAFGEISHQPKGFYDQNTDLLIQLI